MIDRSKVDKSGCAEGSRAPWCPVGSGLRFFLPAAKTKGLTPWLRKTKALTPWLPCGVGSGLRFSLQAARTKGLTPGLSAKIEGLTPWLGENRT
jgi:hypothetical protein